jgi:hypothetical protein
MQSIEEAVSCASLPEKERGTQVYQPMMISIDYVHAA